MTGESQNPVEIECVIRMERADSIGIWVGDYDRDAAARPPARFSTRREVWVWLPRTEILDRSEGLGEGFVTIPLWLAEDRELTDCAAEAATEQGRLL